MTILVTGGAGFIGAHVAARLLERGERVRVLDNLDPFYDPAIKRRNLERLRALGAARFEAQIADLRDPAASAAAVRGVAAVLHLAALAGVRPSIQDPARYVDVNVNGTQVLLSALTGQSNVPVLFASSSSVYGGRREVPFRETDPVDRPVSPYAASKKAGELLCHTFHHLHGNAVWCLRLFTVYGPGQRPEMAIHQFSRRLLAGQPIPFFGDGSTRRDYTYVDDVVDGVLGALAKVQGYAIYNLGGAATTTLTDLVAMLEQTFGRKAQLDRQPEQAGDVPVTCADTSAAARAFGFNAKVPLRDGLARFGEWYLRERAAGRLP